MKKFFLFSVLFTPFAIKALCQTPTVCGEICSEIDNTLKEWHDKKDKIMQDYGAYIALVKGQYADAYAEFKADLSACKTEECDAKVRADAGKWLTLYANYIQKAREDEDSKIKGVDVAYQEIINTLEAKSAANHCKCASPRSNDKASKSNSPISTFPNPSSGKITVSYTGTTGLVQFIIYNITGKIVFNRTEDANNSHQFDLSNLNSGIYLLEARNGKDVSRTKFMIEK